MRPPEVHQNTWFDSVKFFAFDFEKTPTTRTRGQAIVEFALLLPFLLVLIGGAVDFGLSIFAGHIAQNAAREGARLAATVPPPGPVNEGPLDRTACLSSASSTLQWACSKIPASGLFSDFTLESSGVTGDFPDQGITVTASGTYSWFLLDLIGAPLPLLGFSGFPNEITITRSVTMRWEWQSLP